MSEAKCIKCDREIKESSDIEKAIRNFGNCFCKICKDPLHVTVSAVDVLMLPEPYQSEAMCIFSGCD